MIIKDKALSPYYVKVEDNTYMLQKPTLDKDGHQLLDKKGKPVYSIHGYFHTIATLIIHLIQIKLSEEIVCVTLKQFLEKQFEYNRELRGALCKTS